MGPALAQALVFCWDVTWAVTEPSALNAWETKCSESAVPQMSPPPPTSFHVPPLVSWSWPGGRAPPMSPQDHAAGQVFGGGCEPASSATLSKVVVDCTTVLLASLAMPPTRGSGRLSTASELGT